MIIKKLIYDVKTGEQKIVEVEATLEEEIILEKRMDIIEKENRETRDAVEILIGNKK